MNQERLKELLHYSEETGEFSWRVPASRSIKAGDIAGSIHHEGYRVIVVDGKQYLAHRLAWLYVHGVFPETSIDHINGVRDCNKITNLRVATPSENKFNTGKCKKNTSGFKGVSFCKGSNKWRSQCKAKGRSYHIGLFDTPEAASCAYQAFAKSHHGKFFNSGEETK